MGICRSDFCWIYNSFSDEFQKEADDFFTFYFYVAGAILSCRTKILYYSLVSVAVVSRRERQKSGIGADVVFHYPLVGAYGHDFLYRTFFLDPNFLIYV